MPEILIPTADPVPPERMMLGPYLDELRQYTVSAVRPGMGSAAFCFGKLELLGAEAREALRVLCGSDSGRDRHRVAMLLRQLGVLALQVADRHGVGGPLFTLGMAAKFAQARPDPLLPGLPRQSPAFAPADVAPSALGAVLVGVRKLQAALAAPDGPNRAVVSAHAVGLIFAAGVSAVDLGLSPSLLPEGGAA